MSEEQLERSILERKASDELRAIATAMSLEPVARLRKADLVNQILRAAGVEVEGTLPLHASGAASLQSPLSNGAAADKGQAADAEDVSASKPARARTSRARTVKTRSADSTPDHAEVNGSGGGQARKPGESIDDVPSQSSALVSGNDPEGPAEGGDTVAGRARQRSWRAASVGAAVRRLRALRPVAQVIHGPVSSRRTQPAVPVRAPRPLIGCPGRFRRRRARNVSLSTLSPGEAIRVAEIGQAGQIDAGNRRGRRRRGRQNGSVAVKSAARWGSGSRVAGRARAGARLARPEGRGLRLPAHEWLPAEQQGSSTSRSRRPAGSRCAVATPSRVPAGRRGRARSTRRCCGSTRSAG